MVTDVTDRILGCLLGALLAMLFGYLCTRLEYWLDQKFGDGAPPADLQPILSKTSGGSIVSKNKTILGTRTITITCHLCGCTFEAEVPKVDVRYLYTRLEDGTYDGSDADHWCDRCEQDDQTAVTQDWVRR